MAIMRNRVTGLLAVVVLATSMVATAIPAQASSAGIGLNNNAVSSPTGGSITYVVGDTGGGTMVFFEIDWRGPQWIQGHNWAGGCPASGLLVTVDGTPDAVHDCAGGVIVGDYYTWFGLLATGAPVGSTVVVSWDSSLLTTPSTAGTYEVGVWYAQDSASDLPAPPDAWSALYVSIVAPGQRNLTLWHQSVGRGSPEETCPSGYAASWEEWPHGGAGGWVCTKDQYAYYPDEPVR
jgi:hypothetical protein